MTEAQKQARAAYEQAGTVRGAARLLGKDPKTVRKALQRIGVLKPYAAPMLEPCDGQILRGVSTMTRTAEGLPQWVKTSYHDEAILSSFRQAVERIADDVTGAAPAAMPKRLAEDTMVILPQGDPHIGMLSWAAETGDDWDLKIAERVLYDGACCAFDSAPDAALCRIINLGDFFHSDDQSNQTKRSGHQLDVDSRWARVLEVGIRIQRRIIDRALEQFGSVEVDNVRGNHDEHSAMMLSHVLNAWYRNEPRVTVEMSPAAHRYREFGRCFIGSHHGHMAKGVRLPMLMAASQPEAWGRTKYRQIYTGHLHNDALTEYPGCKVAIINTLAGRDAYAAGGGWLSGREQKLDVWNKQTGLKSQHVISLEEIGG